MEEDTEERDVTFVAAAAATTATADHANLPLETRKGTRGRARASVIAPLRLNGAP